MLKYVFATALVVTIAAPAFAATQYFVAQDASSHKCSIVEKKPDGKTMMMIGKAAYASQADASTALKGAAECK